MEDLSQQLEEFEFTEIPAPTRLRVKLVDGKKTRGLKRTVFEGLDKALTVSGNSFSAHFKKNILIREIRVIFENNPPENARLIIPSNGTRTSHDLRTSDNSSLFSRPNEISKSIEIEFKQKNQKIREIIVLYTPIPALKNLSNALSQLPSLKRETEELYSKAVDAANEAHEARVQLEESLDQMNSELSEKKNQLEIIQVEISEKTAELQVHNREMESLNEKQLTIDERLHKSKAELSSTTKELSEKTEELRRLKLSIDQYPDSLEGYREEASEFVNTYKIYIAWSFGVLAVIILALAIGGLLVANSAPFDMSDALAKIIVRAPIVLTLGFVSYFLIKFINRLFSLIEEFNKKSSRLTQVSVLASHVGDVAEKVSSDLSTPKNRLSAVEAYDKAANLKLKILSRELGRYDDYSITELSDKSEITG